MATTTRESGQRTRLIYGGVAAEVSLTKTSGKPKEAEHQTRRMIGDRLAEEVRAEALALWRKRSEAKVEEVARDGGVEQPAAMAQSAVADVERHVTGDPLGESGLIEYHDGPTITLDDPYADLAEERVEQGVTLDDGTFVDLTEQLAQIDERTKIDGLEVVQTIHTSAVPRYRVRDSHWVGLAPDTKGPRPAKVLALLWRSLRASDSAAVVKWTKRVNQALGIIVAQGRDEEGQRTLCLLELEWSANMRAPGPRATMPLDVGVSVREAAHATALAEALRVGPSYLDTVRDERNGKRAELLAAAREGRLASYVPPAEREAVSEEVDVAEAMAAAAAR